MFKSLQGLRGVMFLGVFLSHFGVLKIGSALSSMGVCVFFVLSGFCMYVKDDNDVNDLPIGVKKQVLFGYNKMMKLYPLHIIMMLFAIISWTISHFDEGIDWIKFLITFLTNIFLIDDWFPRNDVFFQFNIVTWFLSALLLIYMFYPSLARIVSRLTIADCLFSISNLAILMVMFVLLVSSFEVKTSYVMWLEYEFPILRLGDFAVGVMLGRIFLESNISEQLGRLESLYEVVLLLSSLLIVLIWTFLGGIYCLEDIYFLPLSGMIVFVLARSRGVVSKFLVRKVFIWLGNISSRGFLIHVVVINYTHKLYEVFMNQAPPFILWVVFSFLLTVFVIYLYDFCLIHIKRD